jgi:hypothetical protein
MGFKQKIKHLLRVSQHIMLILQARKFILAPKLILLYVLVEKTQRVTNMLQKLHQGQNCQASNRLNFTPLKTDHFSPQCLFLLILPLSQQGQSVELITL